MPFCRQGVLLVLLVAGHGKADGVNSSTFDRAAAISGWTRDHVARPDEELQLSFYVKQTHTEQLQQLLQNVSDPSSPTYGHYLTKAEVDALTAPRSEDIDTVQAALRGYPVELWEDGSLIQATVPVSFAQSLLGGDFVHYCRDGEAGGGRSCAVRNPTAEVPSALSGACDLITPLNDPLPPLFAGPIIGGPELSGPPQAVAGPHAPAQGALSRAALKDLPEDARATVAQAQAAVAQAQHFFDSTVMSPLPPQGFAAGSQAQPANATHQGGCCFSIGYGAFMKPCCLRTWRIAADASCDSSEARVGGAPGHRVGACPASADEAAQFIEQDRPQASIDEAVGKTLLGSARPMLGAAKPLLSASMPPPHRTRVAPVGCCWTIGYGDLMGPCCLNTWEAADESNCFAESPQRRLAGAGGDSGYNATGCPGTSSEAQSWAFANAHRSPSAPTSGTRPLAGVRGAGARAAPDSESPAVQATDEPRPLHRVLVTLGALAAVAAFTAAVMLALRPRNGNRTRPLLQSSPADTADDAAE